MENNQLTLTTISLSAKDAKALEIGRKLLDFASQKDFTTILNNTIRLVTTHENPCRIKIPIQDLSDDLHEIRDLLEP